MRKKEGKVYFGGAGREKNREVVRQREGSVVGGGKYELEEWRW